MAYDEKIADRIRKMTGARIGISERKMFGGIAFMLYGNMFCGVLGKELVLRLGNDGAVAALKRPHTRKMDFTGKPIKSMIYLSPEGIKDDAELMAWIKTSMSFARKLPKKAID